MASGLSKEGRPSSCGGISRLSRNSSPFNKQNELIRSLRKQLEAKERELADQRWLFEQFLKSPSWRLTYPIRWLAKQVRALRALLKGQTPRPALGDEASDPSNPEPAEAAIETSSDLKQFFTDFYRIQLQSFLASRASLQLPHSAAPE